MSGLFIEFRDPLFGIIVFFILVFIVAFFSYWWGRYKLRGDERTMERFAAQFHKLPSEAELKSLILQGGLSDKSWILLAHAYEKSGDYEKAVITSYSIHYTKLYDRVENGRPCQATYSACLA